MKKLLLFLSLFSVAFASWAQFEDEEPLPPEEVFKPRVFAVDANTIRAEWTVLKGYYLYKDKFKFKSLTDGISLGEPSFPKGKVKEDEFFGKVETYRKKVAIDIPITRTANAPYELTLETVSQGCADIGLCYPPQKVNLDLALLAKDEVKTPVASKTESSTSILSSISKSLGIGGGQDEFLPPDQAFVFSSEVIDGNTVLANWDIADGYYLYQNKFKFTLLKGDGVQLGQPAFPKGKEKEDEFFGLMEVYYEQAPIRIPLTRTNLEPVEIEIKAEFQGCADAGFCYPPDDEIMVLSLPAGNAGSAMIAPASGGGNLSEQDTIAQTLKDSSVWWIILSFFGFGLLLSFTPCVFPMIPILSSIIAGQGDNITTRKAFSMSLVYVLAMALTYTVAGVVAGLFGQNLQAAFQDPWILGSFAVVFVALSLSMFGFYDLQLPASWQTKLTEVSNSQKGGTLAGVGVMGFLSALIVGPCVAAPLAGALIYIGQTGDAVLGGIALFALSMGMGAPLLAIGTSAGKLLPRAGAWMDAVKAFFGVMLLAVAIWMLERIVPPAVSMLMWAVLLIVSAIYMGALSNLEQGVSGWRKLWKGVGVVMLVYGGLMLIGVASNSTDPLQPLRGVSLGAGSGGGSATVAKLPFKMIKSIDDLNREIKTANAAGKPVMLDFYADWCVSCKEMERYTFSKPAVQAALSKGLLLKADVTDNDDIDKALMKSFGIIGPPSILFFTNNGEELRDMRLVGFLEADRFQAHVERAFN